MKKSFDSSSFRLSLMMLLQYMMFAVWWVPFAAYLVNINVAGCQNTLMLSSMAIGCIKYSECYPIDLSRGSNYNNVAVAVPFVYIYYSLRLKKSIGEGG